MSNKLFSCKKCGHLISDYYGCESEPCCLDCSPPRMTLEEWDHGTVQKNEEEFLENISISSPGEIKISFGDTKMCIITEDEPAEDCNHAVQTDPTVVEHINQTGFLEVFFDYIFEVTHSCTLEFANGDVVEIPPPEGEGWEEEILFDEWTEKFNNTKKYTMVKDYGVLCRDNITHEKGLMIFAEIFSRAYHENARVLSTSRWTRETKIAEDSEKEAPEWRTKYPLLNGNE